MMLIGETVVYQGIEYQVEAYKVDTWAALYCLIDKLEKLPMGGLTVNDSSGVVILRDPTTQKRVLISAEQILEIKKKTSPEVPDFFSLKLLEHS